MNRKPQFINKQYYTKDAFIGQVKGIEALNEDLAATIKTNEYTAIGTANTERHKLDRKMKKQRYKKNIAARQKVDGAYVDRVLAGVSLGDSDYG